MYVEILALALSGTTQFLDSHFLGTSHFLEGNISLKVSRIELKQLAHEINFLNTRQLEAFVELIRVTNS